MCLVHRRRLGVSREDVLVGEKETRGGKFEYMLLKAKQEMYEWNKRKRKLIM